MFYISEIDSPFESYYSYSNLTEVIEIIPQQFYATLKHAIEDIDMDCISSLFIYEVILETNTKDKFKITITKVAEFRHQLVRVK